MMLTATEQLELAQRVLEAHPELRKAWKAGPDPDAKGPRRSGGQPSRFKADIARMWGEGATVKQTADALGISQSAVNQNRKRIKAARQSDNAAAAAETSNT